MPFSTTWVASTRFAAAPVSMYAGVFVLVNLAYLAFAWEVLEQAEVQQTVSARVRQITRARSFTTLRMFVLSAIVSIKFPLGAFALICCVLFAYLWPEGLARSSND